MDFTQLLTLAIVLLPLVAVVINGLLGFRLREATGPLACVAMGLTALCSIRLWVHLAGGGAPVQVVLWEWIAVGGLVVNWSFTVDPLTVVMLLVVSVVGSLVFVYSLGYMKGDPGYPRFFTYLPLFAFSMYLLVLGDNFLVLFVGWEGVGLCSYLLIGFWYKELFSETMSNADAGRKAFVVNRIGDFGFLLGMFLIYWLFGSLDFRTVFPQAQQLFAHHVDSLWMIAITLLLFVGATGKSAQIPLYVWLPDAMAGPTPVSALIHAATMVTAGVYMVARCSALFVLAPTTLLVVALVGTLTAFLAASIAITQRDIKKVLAYSTVSQLGYMFLACGAGAFATGIFHVYTHAFFKGCLFLCAGSVIHALHHEQDMYNMGGLRRFMPVTHITYLLSCAAIAGVPLFSGFFSKDAILEHAFAMGGVYIVLWVLGVATALMTAFYMFRSYYLTFRGEPRMDAEKQHHLHESPATMTVPLALLATGAVLAGYVGIPFVKSWNWFAKFLEPSIAHLPQAHEHHLAGGTIAVLTLVSVVVALAGIALAYWIYQRNWPRLPEQLARRLRPLYDLSYHKWWVDELYALTAVRVVVDGARLCLGLDRHGVDGVVNGAGHTARSTAGLVRLLHNGRVQAYMLIMVLALTIITALLVVAQMPEMV